MRVCGNTLRSYHWSGLLFKDWQIILLDYLRRRRPHNPCTAHSSVVQYICIYIHARAHMRVQNVSRKWHIWCVSAHAYIHIIYTHVRVQSIMRKRTTMWSQTIAGHHVPPPHTCENWPRRIPWHTYASIRKKMMARLRQVNRRAYMNIKMKMSSICEGYSQRKPNFGNIGHAYFNFTETVPKLCLEWSNTSYCIIWKKKIGKTIYE